MPRAAKSPVSQPVFREPVFNEATQTVDPGGFLVPHASDKALYKEIQADLTKKVVGFDKSRVKDGEVVELGDIYGAHGSDVIKQINAAGKIIFHALGDSGASTAGKKYQHELDVSDQVTMDCHTSDQPNHPAFLFHLGDVVYDFGEAQYYYDQFYDPFRNYPLPIFGIPGNHDSFITPNTPKGSEPLAIFSRQFCSPTLTITPEAKSLHRTAMMQPGVYFTLDAPFVRIIGLFSNALEDPGVISNKSGKWPTVPNFQLPYLEAQLQKIKDDKYKGAVILAVHHPPFSYAPPPGQGSGGNHGSSSEMLAEIDAICSSVGIYPHAFLSAHAHNYQRYTRTVKFNGDEYDVPFVVCGDGGHNVNRVVQGSKGHPAVEPNNGISVDYLDINKTLGGGLLLEKYDDTNYGYLRITVDAEQLRIGFHQVGASTLAQSRFDMVTVELKSHTMVAN
jgi:hypothetical protein